MELSYHDKVFKMIYDLPMGGEFVIEGNVAPENRDKFIEAVNLYKFAEYDKLYGYKILLSETKISKTEIEELRTFTNDQVEQWNTIYYSKERIAHREVIKQKGLLKTL